MNLWRVTKSRTIFSSPNHNRLPRLLPAGRSSLKGIATWGNQHQPSGPDEPADHPTHNVSPGPTEWRRPSEIPYQTKIANLVQLVGVIERPVEIVSSDDGTCSASTVLTHHRAEVLPHFRILITFQGELAETAAFHLKENDLVYVTGKLSGEATSFSIGNAKTYVKVVVQSLNFVKRYGAMKKESSKVTKNNQDFNASWRDLVANPQKWWDYRMDKTIIKFRENYPDFVNKDSGKALWLIYAPEWVMPKLEGLEFVDQRPKEGKSHSEMPTDKSAQDHNASWTEPVTNPQQRWDNRTDKLNGKIMAGYPDFNKDSRKGLYLHRAPDSVLPKLEALAFVNQRSKEGKCHSETLTDESGQGCQHPWLQLFASPHKWRDMRMHKLHGLVKSNFPDFKNRETGEGLWLNVARLNVAPEWVLEKVEGMVFDEENHGLKERKSGEDEPWRDLVNNPDDWVDRRSTKVGPKHPDFVNKINGQVLWLGLRTPSWALQKLTPLKSKEEVAVDN